MVIVSHTLHACGRWPAAFDVYPNHLLVPKIQRPLLIIHGTEDEVIPLQCGQVLFSLAKNKYPPLWAEVSPLSRLGRLLGELAEQATRY